MVGVNKFVGSEGELHTYVLPPVAVKEVAIPGQVYASVPALIVGKDRTVTISEPIEVHPVSVTVT